LLNIGCNGDKAEGMGSSKSGRESGEVSMDEIKESKDEGGEKESYVKGEVLLKFKQDVPEGMHINVIEEYGCSVLNVIENLNVYRVKIPEDKTVPEIIEILNNDERIKYAEPNMIYSIQE